jgi:hypothetical protein
VLFLLCLEHTCERTLALFFDPADKALKIMEADSDNLEDFGHFYTWLPYVCDAISPLPVFVSPRHPTLLAYIKQMPGSIEAFPVNLILDSYEKAYAPFAPNTDHTYPGCETTIAALRKFMPIAAQTTLILNPTWHLPLTVPCRQLKYPSSDAKLVVCDSHDFLTNPGVMARLLECSKTCDDMHNMQQFAHTVQHRMYYTTSVDRIDICVCDVPQHVRCVRVIPTAMSDY